MCSHDLIEAFVVPWPFLISGVQFSKETFFSSFLRKATFPVIPIFYKTISLETELLSNNDKAVLV